MYLAQIMRYPPPTFLLSYLKFERHSEWQVLCQYMFAYKTETPFLDRIEWNGRDVNYENNSSLL